MELVEEMVLKGNVACWGQNNKSKHGTLNNEIVEQKNVQNRLDPVKFLYYFDNENRSFRNYWKSQNNNLSFINPQLVSRNS